MSDGMLEMGEVEIPDWSADMNVKNYIAFREAEHEHGPRIAFMLHDITFVRSWLRKQRYGEGFDPEEFYAVNVKWKSTGETARWVFDHTVGWPVENSKPKDWRAEWKKYHGGVA